MLKRVAATLLVIVLITFSSVGVASIPDRTPPGERINMTYLHLGTPAQQLQYINKTNGAVDIVSPSYFDLNADGSLLFTSKYQANFVEEMHRRGIKVVPYLSNHWDQGAGRVALANRELLTTQIAEAVKKYQLDGVNVDIENLTEVDRENYTDLVRLLREKMPDKLVSVAVPANPNRRTTGWVGCYDNLKLSEYADYLMLMAYDESYRGSAEKPVASIQFVENSIKTILDEGVSPTKVVLGVPFYGRIWGGNGSMVGDGISSWETMDLVKQFKGTVSYDALSQSPKATFTIPNGQEGIIGWKKLTAGTYGVWFENAQSIKAKLDLVDRYGLRGSGSWSLGQELPEIWDWYELKLQGRLFTDIDGHWAAGDILAMANRKWMVGVAKFQFGPETYLTRAQAAAILVRVLGLGLPSGAQPTVYADVAADHWAKESITIVSHHGLLRGTAQGQFAPDMPVTREQMAVILHRVLGYAPKNADPVPFADVHPASWANESIRVMQQHGILGGYGDGSFRPGQPVKRAEMAALLNRLAAKLSDSQQ